MLFIEHLLCGWRGYPRFSHFVSPPPDPVAQMSVSFYLVLLFLQVNKLAGKIAQPEGHPVSKSGSSGAPISLPKKKEREREKSET